MEPSYWLIKQEPDDYAWSTFARDKSTRWTGVRNYQARNFLRAMRRGDLVLYYHSGKEKQVVGIAGVDREAYPDPTAEEGDWSAVDLACVKVLTSPVTLAAIKATPALNSLLLLRHTRLSVMPVRPPEFALILELGRTTLNRR